MEQTRNIIGTEINTRVHKVYNPEFDYKVRNENANFKQKSVVIKTNLIGKVRIVCFFTAVSLLAFLFIYNFIAMNNINANIAMLQNSIQSEQSAIQDLKMQINALSNEALIIEKASEAGFSESYANNDNILIVNVPKVEVMESQPQTNWFNDFCEFVSSIFGG